MGSFKVEGLDWFLWHHPSVSGSFGMAPCCPRGPQWPMPAQQYEGHCYIALTSQSTSLRPAPAAKPGPFLLGRKSIALQDRSQGLGDSKPWLRACCGWSLQRKQTSSQTRFCSRQKFMAVPLGGFPKQQKGRKPQNFSVSVDESTDDLRRISDPS